MLDWLSLSLSLPPSLPSSLPPSLSPSLPPSLSGYGTFQLTFSYLPYFSAACASVTMAAIDSELAGSSHLDKTTLLPCLYEGDSGRVSPNSVVSFNIRKHGGDVFSTAVRQHGFPYKWVQTLCGISVMGEGVEGGTVQPQSETSVENIGSIMAALRRRFKAQINLARQIAKLGNFWSLGVW